MNRTLMNLVRSMLYHKGIEKQFWAEALGTAVYLRNRMTSRGVPQNVTPHHLWMGSAPNLEYIRVFHHDVSTYCPVTKRRNWNARAREAVMIGYSFASKRYKLWDLELKKVIISWSVKFDEESISVD